MLEDLAILTTDQAFCATCFRCMNCKRRIETLRYAGTSHGIFCVNCHDSVMAWKQKKIREEVGWINLTVYIDIKSHPMARNEIQLATASRARMCRVRHGELSL